MANDRASNKPVQLAKRIARLGETQRDAVERLLASLERSNANEHESRPAQADPTRSDKDNDFDWPHAPVHRLEGCGTFMVTAGTLHKQHFFREAWSLDLVQSWLLRLACDFHWHLEAWSCFSNHYHFVGHAMQDARSLKPFLTKLHAETAREVNKRDGQVGRQVWFNFWETRLTFEKSYLARLGYVHRNPVKHELVRKASQYRWCSADWFERTARSSQVQTIYSFKTDRINVIDDFEVVAPSAERKK